MKFKSSLILMLAVLLLVVAACGKEKSNEEGSMKLIEEGKLTYAVEGAFKPFNYMDGNEIVGFDADLGKRIAEELGLEANPQKARFDGIPLGIQNNRYDAGITSLTITEERKEIVSFTIPYYQTETRIYTRTDSKVESEEDLKGKEIAVSRGTTFKELASKLTDSSKVKEYDGDIVALQALDKGHHEAVITNNMTGEKAISEGLNVEARGESLMTNQAGIAVAKDNEELLDKINAILREMLESGELQELSEKWTEVDLTVKE